VGIRQPMKHMRKFIYADQGSQRKKKKESGDPDREATTLGAGLGEKMGV